MSDTDRFTYRGMLREIFKPFTEKGWNRNKLFDIAMIPLKLVVWPMELSLIKIYDVADAYRRRCEQKEWEQEERERAEKRKQEDSQDGEEKKNAAEKTIVSEPVVATSALTLTEARPVRITKKEADVVAGLVAYSQVGKYADRKNLEGKAAYIEKEALLSRILREQAVKEAKEKGKPLSADEVMKLRAKEEKARFTANKRCGSLRRKRFEKSGR